MNWREFEEKYGDGDREIVSVRINPTTRLVFWYDGSVVVEGHSNGIRVRLEMAQNRTPDQMEQILKGAK